MGKQSSVETRFRERVSKERSHREWSRARLSKELRDRGFEHLYPSTIAKIESGERAVRIDEATAIADLFKVSLDTLLGRRARPKSDLVYTLRVALETAQQASWQVSSLETTLRDRVMELTEADIQDSQADLVADLDRACKQLAKASQALTQAMRDRKRHKVIKTATAKLALQLEGESDHDEA